MTAISEFTNLVTPYVPACPSKLVEQKVRLAIDELATKSLMLRQQIDVTSEITSSISTVEPGILYTITLDNGNNVILPTYMLVDGRPILPKTEEELDRLDYGWRNSDPGDPSYYYCPLPGSFKFNRTPDPVLTDLVPLMEMKVAYKPRVDATNIPDILFIDWRETIRRGALSFLLDMPKKEWTNIPEGLKHGQFFNAQVQTALARSDRGHTRKPTYAAMRRMF